VKCHYFCNLGSMKAGIDAISKKLSTGYVGKFIVLSLFCLALGNAQVSSLGNASVSGPFFFRHLEFTTDTLNNITDCRAAIGVMTFDGAGHYNLNAQQTITTLAATSLTGAGTYSVGASGAMSIGNPQRNSLFINARVGTEAIVGSTTESGDNTFDLFIAIPAATATEAANVFGGTYLTSSFSLPLGVGTYATNAFFNLNPVAGGVFATINGSGHVLNVNSGQLTPFSVNGASYSANGDGTYSANLGSTGNGPLGGFDNLMVSASGNIILGGSVIAGAQDFLIGVRAYSGSAALTNLSGLFYTGGLRYDARNGTSGAYVGSTNAVPSLTSFATYQRYHEVSAVFSTFDYSGFDAMGLNSNGTYSFGPLLTLGLGPNGKSFVDADVGSTDDPEGFSLDFGIAADALSGTGVYINPQGVLNAASLSPTGGAIAPGEFISIFGSGLASAQSAANPPYPTLLGGVGVTINNVSAPIYLVSPTQLNILVPYSLTGPTATIVVTNNGQASNSVVLPLSTTAPGVFSQNSSGIGPGVVVHTDNSLVTSANPAKKGETITIYLAGLGAVMPAVADGTAGLSSTLSNTVETVGVIIGNLAATVSYSGLAPGFPGLYQVNAVVPSGLSGSGNIGLAVETPEAFAEQITIAIQ
jgi:uncharacterized protein (TIGR03437 family)